MPPLQERAREESGEGDVDDGKEDNIEESEDEDDGEGEGLPVEMLRRKNMDVASMDALKKRIEVGKVLMNKYASRSVDLICRRIFCYRA